MLSESYGKWVTTAVFILITFSLITVSSCSREETTVDGSSKTAPLSGPIIDPNIEKGSLLQMEKMPDDPESLSLLGDKYFESNRFREAIEIYEKVIKLNPGDADAYNDLGLAYHYTGNSDIAADKLRRGAEVEPSYQRIWLSLGFVLLAKGRNEEAKPALQKAVELDPDSNAGKEAKSMLGRLN